MFGFLERQSPTAFVPGRLGNVSGEVTVRRLSLCAQALLPLWPPLHCKPGPPGPVCGRGRPGGTSGTFRGPRFGTRWLLAVSGVGRLPRYCLTASGGRMMFCLCPPPPPPRDLGTVADHDTYSCPRPTTAAARKVDHLHRGGSWWFVVVRVSSWWFLVVCGGSWWFVVVRGGLWWFVVVPKHSHIIGGGDR